MRNEMGNRLEEGVCLSCGGILIEENAWKCCTVCTQSLQKQQALIKAGKKSSPKEPLHVKIGGGLSRTLAARFKK